MSLRFLKHIPFTALSLSCTALFAAPDPPPQSALSRSPKAPSAFIRLWNFNHPSGSTLIVSEDSDSSAPIVETPAESVSAGYVPLSPGIHPLKLETAPHAESTILRFILRVAAGHFVTLLATAPDGSPHLELLDETPPQIPPLSGSLTVRHFIPKASVSVFSTPAVQTRSLSFGTVRTLKGLPRGLTPLCLQATFDGMPSLEWTLQADFSHCPVQALLLILDPYGRFRPRLVPVGQWDLQPPPAEDALDPPLPPSSAP